ncbi:hypothetical protein ACIPY5_15380 [Microbacterium sp. NPDC089698]|uniref:hypothetical protein n=1 Tax=Microbacterium sp. NPDC089698 TaxID=3364200 RepID=UPI0037F5C911
MPEISSTLDDMTPTAPALTRRKVVKTAAWSLPVIAVAVAVPGATASTNPVDPVSCVALPVGAFSVAGGTLVANGADGTLPTSNGNFGTGWTPPKAPSGDWQVGYTQTDSAVAPVPASWWQTGGDPTHQIGFLSLDDNDNRDIAPHTPSVITTTFSVPVKAGGSYEYVLPIYASADYLGPQYLDISIMGAGVNQPGAVQGYIGNPAIALIPDGLAGYPHFATAQNPVASFTPTSDGVVVFTYTFTLSYVTAGARQNADLFVNAPSLTACA